MSEDAEKLIKEILGDSKSANAKAIVVLSMKFDKLAEAILENKSDTDDRLRAMNDKFKKLQVWFFFVDNPKWLFFFIFCILAMIGVNESTINYIKNFIK